MILSYVRTIILYLILLLVIRLMGKRQLGQLEPSEFVVTMLVANLAAIPMQDGGIPLWSGVLPILTVLGLELVLTLLSLKSVLFRKVLCGTPVILIENGILLQENLKKTRLTLDEFRATLRQNNILDLGSVKYAILETGGALAVFPYSSSQSEPILPITIIQAGKLAREDLRRAGKDRSWLRKVLKGTPARDVLLLTVDETGTQRCIRKEKP